MIICHIVQYTSIIQTNGNTSILCQRRGSTELCRIGRVVASFGSDARGDVQDRVSGL